MSIETIISCFKKASITTEVQCAVADCDNPFADFQESLDALKATDPEMVPEDLSADNLVDVDKDVIATAPVLTEEDILEHFREHRQESEGEDERDNVTNNDVAPERPSRSEVESAPDILKKISLYSTTGDEMQSVILKFENLFSKGTFSLF